MKTRNLIRDGLTRKGYFQPAENYHDGMSFTYRPMLAEDALRCDREIERLSNEDAGAAAHAMADALQSRVVTWSEVDENDKPVAVSFDSLRRQPIIVLRTIYYIVAGWRESDPMPAATEEQVKSRLDELRAKAAGESPGQSATEAELKNSVTQ